jgi:endonuclease/exonuclease/phosphatase family metal-dependent hydrolase
MLQLITLLSFFLSTGQAEVSHVMDGRFEDWTSPVVAEGPEGGIVKAVRVADDPHFVYLQIDLERPATLQGLDRELRIELDLDGSDRTGMEGAAGMSGVDAVVLFSPRDADDGEIQSGTKLIGLSNGRPTRTTSDGLGVVAMPTHGSDRFEIRLDRLPAFRGKTFDAQVLTVNPGGTTRAGPMFSHTLASRSARRPLPAVHDPAAPSRGIRVTSWNGERGALFENPSSFARTFEALKPDLILLQELPSKADAPVLAEWFDRMKDDDTWQALVSGGSLRVAVVCRHKLDPIPELEKVSALDPRGSKRFVRAVGGLAEIRGRRVLVASVHLKCCGRLGSSEDQKRRSEVDAIHEAVQTAIARLKPDEVIIGGDLNLVGTSAVLERLCEGLAPDGGDLVVTEPIRPAGDATTSWEKPGQSFVPGRLDFILVGGGGRITNAVVVDPIQLGDRWRRKHGIAKDPPSDHLAISVDVEP